MMLANCATILFLCSPLTLALPAEILQHRKTSFMTGRERVGRKLEAFERLSPTPQIHAEDRPSYDPSLRPLDFEVDEALIQEEALFPLSDEDYRRASGLQAADISPADGGLGLYSSDYFEGDIIGSLAGRNAVRDKTILWPNGRIPYVLSNKYSQRDRAVLAAAMKGYQDKTCIQFVPKNSTDYNFVYLYPGNGCASQVGRGGGMQLVSLGIGCIYVGISQHELMHVVGFWHEQSRYDRDDYIRINWENIEPGMEYNFDKYSWDDIQSLDAPYDYGSVMHYGTHAFAKGYGPTISPRNSSAVIIGQRYGLSAMDIEKINRLYECKKFLTKTNYTLRFEHN